MNMNDKKSEDVNYGIVFHTAVWYKIIFACNAVMDRTI